MSLSATKIQKSKELLIRTAEPDDYARIRDFLLESSHLYPAIDSWWDDRVRPMLERGRRIVLVADDGNSLDGLFIGKPGDSAKLCTLRLRESVRNQGVGRVLLTEGLRRLLASHPSRFHVTISEGAEEGCVPFFESIGFHRIAIQPNRYKMGVDEFVYSSSQREIEEAVRNESSQGMERTLFGIIPQQMANQHTILMSLRPEFADLIVQGRKSVEFRRRFSKKYEGATIVFYITHPVKRFMFTATVAKVDHRPKDELWNSYQAQGAISRYIFDRYFSGTSFGYAIHLSNLTEIPNRLPLKHAQEIDPGLRPPQSFQRLEPRSPLVRALNLAVHI